MLVKEYRFTDYYHQYITIEADALTDTLKENIDIQEEDCYALCSCYCKKDGSIFFNVLSVGPSWEKCDKGLDNGKMLGYWAMEQVQDMEARLPQPSYEMIQKNVPFLKTQEQEEDEDLLLMRKDGRLDDIRDIYNADTVMAGFVVNHELEEYPIHLTGIDGILVKGELIGNKGTVEPVYAFMYLDQDVYRLAVLALGSKLSLQEEQILDRIQEVADRFHLSYTGVSLRS